MNTSLKELTDSCNLTSLPSKYAFSQPHSDYLSDHVVVEEIPTIDFSLLVDGTVDQRSQIVQDLGQACREWGFFTVVNHGVEERVSEQMLKVCRDFFDLPEAAKRKYVGRPLWDPIQCGSSFHPKKEEVFYWRDYIKVLVHPQFHSPDNPSDFREVSMEYCKRMREIAKELLRGISESLGLEEWCLEKASGLDTGLQTLVVNFYPRCPQPKLALGLPPHSDHGLLTILTQSHVGGLQVKHDDKWFPVHPIPNTFVVNVGDQLEVLSNGRYKSVLHRALVNDQNERISVGTANGPSPDMFITPAPELVDGENPPAYRKVTYKEYIELQKSNQLNGKSCLDLVRI